MKKQQYVSALKRNSQIDDYFIITNPLFKVGKNASYIDCNIVDKTGSMPCKIWEQANKMSKQLQNGHVYKVVGTVSEYMGNLNANINIGVLQLTDVTQTVIDENLEKEFIQSDLTPAVKDDLEHMIKSISNLGLCELVKELTSAYDFFNSPAAKYNHHAFSGGLALHSWEVAKISTDIAATFNQPIDTDLLIAGSILHDIGKAEMFKKTGLFYEPSTSYITLGHATMGVIMLTKAKTYSLLSDKLKDQLEHIIISHHGAFGVVKPMCVESYIISQADNISAQVTMLYEDIKSATSNTSMGAKTRQLICKFEE